MIVGIGIDIVEISRIAHALGRFGHRFAARILGPKERRDPITPLFLAGRFAAKEAIVKAIGTGFSGGIGFHDLEIAPSALGQPTVRLHQAAVARLQALGGSTIHLSISHSRDYAVAVAIIETEPEVLRNGIGHSS